MTLFLVVKLFLPWGLIVFSRNIINDTTLTPTQMVKNHTRMTVKKKKKPCLALKGIGC